jgi:hypothetical protein
MTSTTGVSSSGGLLQITGLASGLDTNAIVSGLMFGDLREAWAAIDRG